MAAVALGMRIFPRCMTVYSAPDNFWGFARFVRPFSLARITQLPGDPTTVEPQIWPPDLEQIATPRQVLKNSEIILKASRKYEAWPWREVKRHVTAPRIVSAMALPRFLVSDNYYQSRYILDLSNHLLWMCVSASGGDILNSLNWVMHPQFGIAEETERARYDVEEYWTGWKAEGHRQWKAMRSQDG